MPSCVLTHSQDFSNTRHTQNRDTFLLDIELVLGNLIATAAAAGALLITSRRGRPLGGHLYVQVAAVVGTQHGRRRRRVGRGRATVGGVNHRHDQRLADVQSRRGQIVDGGAVFAQHVDLLGRPARHRVGHAEIVRFVGTSGPRVVQVVVLSVFCGEEYKRGRLITVRRRKP